MIAVRLKNAEGRFTAARDEHGVPHVAARSWLDALFGLGYMHALDRGTQMLFARSVASGRGAQDIANRAELLETDRFFRRLGLHLGLTEEVRGLNDRLFGQLTAYCEGVNAAIKGAGRSLPMWATGFLPQPWNQQSILLIGKLLSFGGLAVSQMQNERILIELIHAGVRDETLRELFAPRLDDVDFDMIRQVKMANQLSDEALELLTDLPRLAGSNAWAVAPQRSESGSALLASDPHLEINRLPAIWYEAVLQWDNHYVMGATLPGCPLFAVARTDRVAWGVTYMKGDTIDFFVEDCRPSGQGWQYRRGGQWRTFDIREETIQRKASQPEVLQVLENEQGVLTEDPDEMGGGYHLSIAWTGNRPGNGAAIGAWLDVVAADSARQGMDVVRECTQPTLCWVFADRDGHIGMQACGRFPKRGGRHNGLTPIPAWDSKNHWSGYLATDILPRVYDPPCGYVSTANEELNPPGAPLLVTQPLPAYRKRRIDELLGGLPAATIADMQAIQYDLVSLQARELLKLFLPHLEEGRTRERLRAWDCRYAPDSHEAALFQRLYRNVLIEMLGHEKEIGWRRMLYLCSRAGFSMMVLTTADRLLTRDDSPWWRGRDKGELIRRAAARLDGAAEETWSQVNNFHFTDRFFGMHQVGHILGYNTRKYPMAGNHATPFQGHVLQTATRETTFAPSYHFVTDLGVDQAWTNLPGGPSESRFSRFYKNGIQMWLTGEYKRLAPEQAIDAPSTA